MVRVGNLLSTSISLRAVDILSSRELRPHTLRIYAASLLAERLGELRHEGHNSHHRPHSHLRLCGLGALGEYT